jgi:hypothetical protein
MDGRSWTSETVETKSALAASSSLREAAAAAMVALALVGRVATGAPTALRRSTVFAQTPTAQRR